MSSDADQEIQQTKKLLIQFKNQLDRLNIEEIENISIKLFDCNKELEKYKLSRNEKPNPDREKQVKMMKSEIEQLRKNIEYYKTEIDNLDTEIKFYEMKMKRLPMEVQILEKQEMKSLLDIVDVAQHVNDSLTFEKSS